MKKVMKSAMLGVISLIMIGCGTAAKEILVKTETVRTDVFSEVKNTEAPAHDSAVLTIKATIKTHLQGYYALEPEDSLHGKPNYPFLINIDGQAETWKVDGQRESVPLYDEEGKTSRDPDAGEGVKYVLEKKIGLRAGAHKVFLGLPVDDYFKEVAITLKEGDSAVLEFKPVYKYKTRPTRIPAFRREIKDMEIYLNSARRSTLPQRSIFIGARSLRPFDPQSSFPKIGCHRTVGETNIVLCDMRNHMDMVWVIGPNPRGLPATPGARRLFELPGDLA